MIFAVTLPPIRLADGTENPVPGFFAYLGRPGEKSACHFLAPIFATLLKTSLHVSRPTFSQSSGGRTSSKMFLTPHLERPLIDFVPDAGPGLIYITMFRRGAAARPIPQTFWAFHRADERRLLQEAIPAHAATKQRTLDSVFENLQGAVAKVLFFEGRVGGLPSSTRGKTRHKNILRLC